MCKAGKYKKYAFAADTCVLESPISIILLNEKKYLNITHFETIIFWDEPTYDQSSFNVIYYYNNLYYILYSISFYYLN